MTWHLIAMTVSSCGTAELCHGGISLFRCREKFGVTVIRVACYSRNTWVQIAFCST